MKLNAGSMASVRAGCDQRAAASHMRGPPKTHRQTDRQPRRWAARLPGQSGTAARSCLLAITWWVADSYLTCNQYLTHVYSVHYVLTRDGSTSRFQFRHDIDTMSIFGQ